MLHNLMDFVVVSAARRHTFVNVGKLAQQLNAMVLTSACGNRYCACFMIMSDAINFESSLSFDLHVCMIENACI